MSSTMTSLRLFAATNIPISFHPIKPLISITKRKNFVFFSRPISFERISSKKVLQSSPSPASTSNLQPIEELPPKLQEIIKLFQSVEDSKAKYEQLMFYGKNLKPLDSQYKTVENKVRGCVSQVWVRAFLDEDKNVVYEADSDSVLTKGLAALLVTGLSGRPVPEVLRVSPDFALHFGMQLSLTPNRNNGFLNMFRLMQKRALELLVKANDDGNGNGNGVSSNSMSNYVENLNSESRNGGSVEDLKLGSENGSGGSGEISSSGVGLGGRGMRIKEKLEKELNPLELEVEDVSYQHAGHAGVAGSDGETHFNVKIVSKEFEGKSLVKRHRLVYGLLQEELQSGLHALSIVAKTPSEVDAK